MSTENASVAPRGKRRPMTVFHWDKRWKQLLSKLSEAVYGEDMSETMRSILEEYIACFMTDEELIAARKPQLIVYPPPRLQRALMAAQANRKNVASNAPGAGENEGAGSINRIPVD